LRVATIFWAIAGTAMAIEETKYEVRGKKGDFELRRYADHVVAETLVNGSFDEAGNEGFRVLAAYIFGANVKSEKIAMTAPVSQEPRSEKIEMTAPVGQQPGGDAWRITFTMPSRYTMDTLPRPTDARVVLRTVPGKLVAALRYAGSWSEKRYEKKKSMLASIIASEGLETAAEPVFARYNPPFVPPFFRRNEVLIEVREKR
jgi:hypothetical protein